MTPIVFYHRADFDGIASAAIVKRKYPEAELQPYDYGDDIDDGYLEGRDIVLVDCSFEPETMQLVADYATSFVWIDHHKSAIEGVAASGATYDGLQEIGQAGCELTWRYFMGGEMPRVIYLLGRYDVFDLEADPKVLPFQYGMRSMAETEDPTSGIWDGLLQTTKAAVAAVDAICKRGTVCFEYQQVQDEKAVKALSFTVELDGHVGIACNAAGKGSLLFESVFDKESMQLMIPFFMDKTGRWRVSLYSPQDGGVDCSEIAKKYGGGGHRNAAGFECDELPWRGKE